MKSKCAPRYEYCVIYLYNTNTYKFCGIRFFKENFSAKCSTIPFFITESEVNIKAKVASVNSNKMFSA